MLFTRIGRVVSYLLLVASVLRIAQGILIGSEMLGPWREVLPRYSSKATPGEIVDQGIYLLFLAIVLGVIVEIGYAIRASLKV